jgi:hypothetical protein
MGFTFHSAGCVKCAEEDWNKNHTINPNGSPHRAAKAEEKSGVSRRPNRARASVFAIVWFRPVAQENQRQSQVLRWEAR